MHGTFACIYQKQVVEDLDSRTTPQRPNSMAEKLSATKPYSDCGDVSIPFVDKSRLISAVTEERMVSVCHTVMCFVIFQKLALPMNRFNKIERMLT